MFKYVWPIIKKMKNNKQLRDLLYEQEDHLRLEIELIDHDNRIHTCPVYGIKIKDNFFGGKKIVISGDWNLDDSNQSPPAV